MFHIAFMFVAFVLPISLCVSISPSLDQRKLNEPKKDEPTGKSSLKSTRISRVDVDDDLFGDFDSTASCKSNSDCSGGWKCVDSDERGPRECNGGSLCFCAHPIVFGKSCIAIHSLAHLESHQLLYSTHRAAHVLCDHNNSCATPGHLVQYQGRAMMMKSYCSFVRCASKIMKVNSPRYRRGMLVPSLTENLAFTTFAARYETKVEERLLSTAIRFGL